MGTFWELLLIISSRRKRVRILDSGLSKPTLLVNRPSMIEV
jgi:hypothetical protein